MARLLQPAKSASSTLLGCTATNANCATESRDRVVRLCSMTILLVGAGVVQRSPKRTSTQSTCGDHVRSHVYGRRFGLTIGVSFHSFDDIARSASRNAQPDRPSALSRSSESVRTTPSLITWRQSEQVGLLFASEIGASADFRYIGNVNARIETRFGRWRSDTPKKETLPTGGRARKLKWLPPR
jgi:hypothetical protein